MFIHTCCVHYNCMYSNKQEHIKQKYLSSQLSSTGCIGIETHGELGKQSRVMLNTDSSIEEYSTFNFNLPSALLSKLLSLALNLRYLVPYHRHMGSCNSHHSHHKPKNKKQLGTTHGQDISIIWTRESCTDDMYWDVN